MEHPLSLTPASPASPEFVVPACDPRADAPGSDRGLLRRDLLLAVGTSLLPAGQLFAAAEDRSWEQIAAAARGQTVYWNAWAGNETTNAFIAWVGEQLKASNDVTVVHVKLKDTAEAVTRVLSEKTAGRDSGGGVDLIWINGPNFLAMKEQKLLHGPFTQVLPNYRYVDTTAKRSNLIDFTVPVDGMESPWRLAQIVYVYDSARYKPDEVPRSSRAMLGWARQHPGRLTHPTPRNFLGATFLKQALLELTPDAKILQQPATDASFAAATAPLWTWYEPLRPLLWRQGKEFPETGAAQRQLMNDGEVDLLISFDPAEAAVAITRNQLPPTVRAYVLDAGTIGNTSFVAIPYNAAHQEGAMVVANFLLAPATQARAQDPQYGGNFTVLDLGKMTEAQRLLFNPTKSYPGLPTNAQLGTPRLEPHASWMTRVTAEWERRFAR